MGSEWTLFGGPLAPAVTFRERLDAGKALTAELLDVRRQDEIRHDAAERAEG